MPLTNPVFFGKYSATSLKTAPLPKPKPTATANKRSVTMTIFVWPACQASTSA
jgi:hypothetical protein